MLRRLRERVAFGLVVTTSCIAAFSGRSLAASAGCDYWDKFSLDQIERRLEEVHGQWLSIKPTRDEIDAARHEEMRSITATGYRNAAQMVADLDDRFFIRRIRSKKYREMHGGNFTDEELWVFCANGCRTKCAEYADRASTPPRFDAAGALLESNPQLRAMLDETRGRVGEFTLFAQMTVRYCDCNGSDAAIALCKKASSYLTKDF